MHSRPLASERSAQASRRQASLRQARVGSHDLPCECETLRIEDGFCLRGNSD